MKLANLVVHLFLFQLQAYQSDQHNKGKQDICSDPRGKDCEEAESRRRSIVQAAYERDWERVRTLVQKGPDLDATDPDGRTLAMMAAESEQWDMVHWLRERGADINLQDGLQRSVLHIASSHRQWHDMKMLVNNGSDINAVDRLGKTPTIIAASYKEWDIVQWLIERGADINARDGFGRSVLLLAASHNNWRFVKWLLSKGADPMVTDQNRRTLLHLAAVAGNLEVIQILVEDFGVDLNQEDKGSNTPINLAAISNDPKGSVYNYLVYMNEMKSQTYTYRKSNAEYKIRELSLLNRIKKMYDVMSMGESSLDVKIYGRVILVLGNLRSGKSTLVQYLTDGTSKLMSQPVVEGSGLFKIVPINGTAIPTSVYPRLVNYKEKGAVFCDGPRFSDMGTISQDLTAMHFLKKVTEKFRRVKLVFTVSHLAVKRGMNSVEFITFLQHVTTFITNFTYFSKSSCIVVTKFEAQGNDVPDPQLEKAAGISISKAAESMLEELNKDLPAEKRIFFRKAVDFLMIFLRNNEQGNYGRIKVFRRPNTAGPLNKMKRMELSKTRLFECIFDELSYVKVRRGHFDYPLSDTTLATLYKYNKATNREITFAMTSIADHIEDQLFSRARNSDDVFKIRSWFREGCKSVEKLVFVEDDANSMLFSIRMALELINVYPRRISTFKIAHLDKFLKFLQKIMNNKLKITPWEWRDPFRMLLISIRETRDWYDLLSYLYERFVSYDFQANRGKFNFRNLDNWGRGNGLLINENNIETFLKTLDDYKIRRIEAIELRNFHDFEFDSLNRIVKFTIIDKPVTVCEECFTAGSHVSLKSLMETCPGCKHSSTIKIFAANKVFIDRNLVGVNEVVVISPSWEVIGNVEFDLGVESAFRGIGKIFINIDKLTITTQASGRPQPHRKGKVVVYESGERRTSLPQDINDYQSYSLELLKDRFISSRILAFLSDIDDSPQISQHYDMMTLLKELLLLEDKYNDMKEKIDFLPLYESLLKRIQTYAKNPKAGESGVSYKLALTHMCTAVMSKVSSLKQGRRYNLVLNIVEFFRLSTYMVKQVKEKGNQIATTQLKEILQTDLQQRIDQAQQVMKTRVSKAVDNMISAIENTLGDIFKVIKKFVPEGSPEKKVPYFNKLRVKWGFRKIIGFYIFSFLGKCLKAFSSFTGLIVDAVKSGVKIETSVGRNLIKSNTDLAKSVIEQTSDAVSLASLIVNNAIEQYQVIADQIKENSPEAYNGIKTILDDVFKILNERRKVSNIVHLRDDIIYFSDKINARLLEMQNQNKVLFVLVPFEEITEKVKDIAGKVFSAVFNPQGREEFEEDLFFMDCFFCREEIKKLDEMQDEVFSELVPVMLSIKSAVERFIDKGEIQSSVELSMSGWTVDTALRNAQWRMSQMLEGHEESEVKSHMESLRTLIDMQVATFQKLVDYMEQAKLEQNMHELADQNYFKSNYPHEIAKEMEKLDLMITSNILLTHRARALGALKQWVFPFAHDYSATFEIPKQLNYKTNITDLVKHTMEELDTIRLTILTDAAIPTKRDCCTMYSYFDRNNPMGPFYIWKNAENVDFIVSLLSGEEITTSVNIHQKLNFNALKFNYIKLSFYAVDEQKQQELDKLLRNLQMKMTHLGNSHFHCDGKIYTMTSDSLEIKYSFLEVSPGQHTTVNKIFRKLRKGDVMLSPYATWKFQLLDSASKGNFGKLLAFVDYVDVALEGEGQYLDEDCISHCNNNVDEYYNVDGTV